MTTLNDLTLDIIAHIFLVTGDKGLVINDVTQVGWWGFNIFVTLPSRGG